MNGVLPGVITQPKFMVQKKCLQYLLRKDSNQRYVSDCLLKVEAKVDLSSWVDFRHDIEWLWRLWKFHSTGRACKRIRLRRRFFSRTFLPLKLGTFEVGHLRRCFSGFAFSWKVKIIRQMVQLSWCHWFQVALNIWQYLLYGQYRAQTRRTSDLLFLDIWPFPVNSGRKSKFGRKFINRPLMLSVDAFGFDRTQVSGVRSLGPGVRFADLTDVTLADEDMYQVNTNW